MFDQLTFLALAAVAFLAVPGWVGMFKETE